MAYDHIMIVRAAGDYPREEHAPDCECCEGREADYLVARLDEEAGDFDPQDWDEVNEALQACDLTLDYLCRRCLVGAEWLANAQGWDVVKIEEVG